MAPASSAHARARDVKLNVDEVRESIARGAAQAGGAGGAAGLGVGHRHARHARSAVTIGRDPTVELPLQDDGISRRHCRVAFDRRVGFFLEDLSSTNGTLLNGERLQAARSSRRAIASTSAPASSSSPTPTRSRSATTRRWTRWSAPTISTGLIAKRRFDAAYVRAVDRRARIARPLAVMMLDLDGLKAINDTHGHPVGAHTIAEVGKLIGTVVSAQARPAASAVTSSPRSCRARQGRRRQGRRDHPRAGSPRHTLREGRRGRQAHHLHRRHRVSRGRRTAELLLRQADEALYRAKKTGRDRVNT